MSDTEIPQGQQCAKSGCSEQGEDPDHPAPLCPDHLPDKEEDAPTPTKEAEEPTDDDIRDHYRRARGVYEALGDVCGSETLAIADHAGWYTKRDNDDPTTAGEWAKLGRCITFGRDLETFLDRIERVVYATTSYNDPEYLNSWIPCRYDPD